MVDLNNSFETTKFVYTFDNYDFFRSYIIFRARHEFSLKFN